MEKNIKTRRTRLFYWVRDLVNIDCSFIGDIEEDIVCWYSFLPTLFIPVKIHNFMKTQSSPQNFKKFHVFHPQVIWSNREKAKPRTERSRVYPNIRSIHSCKCADTCSLSRAIWCLWMKSIGLSAQGGSFTLSGTNNKTEITSYTLENLNLCRQHILRVHTKLVPHLRRTKINAILIG